MKGDCEKVTDSENFTMYNDSEQICECNILYKWQGQEAVTACVDCNTLYRRQGGEAVTGCAECNLSWSRRYSGIPLVFSLDVTVRWLNQILLELSNIPSMFPNCQCGVIDLTLCVCTIEGLAQVFDLTCTVMDSTLCLCTTECQIPLSDSVCVVIESFNL